MDSPAAGTASAPPLSRVASSSTTYTASPVLGGSPSLGQGPTAPADRKKRRNLLRDYYGISEGSSSGKAVDNMNMDNPDTFNAAAYFDNMNNTYSLRDLLRKENDLLTEIRELDGERQSLVYNHHHELVEASDTIRKMKTRAIALDSSLDSLKASFQSISQLSADLAPASAAPSTSSTPPPTAASNPPPFLNGTPKSPSQKTLSRRRSTLSTLVEDRPAPPTPRATATAADELPPPAEPKFDPLIHLPPLLALPILLRSLSSDPSGRGKADQLWGLYEPALRSWEEEGIEGVVEIGASCRDILRGARARATSSVAPAVNGAAAGTK